MPDRRWTTHSILSALASLRLTFFSLVLLGATIAAAYRSDGSWSAALVPPLALLALNLLAAIAGNGKLRTSAPLLIFHLALLAIVVLAALGRLSALHGKVELMTGGEFDGLTATDYRGYWHRGQLSGVWFRNEGFEIQYLAGRERDRTENRVRWRDEAGSERIGVFDDYRPLKIHGYRFTPTANKGYSAIFEWKPDVGQAIVGSANLPSFPVNIDAQFREFQPPGLPAPLFVNLVFEEDVAPADRPFEFRIPERHHLAVRYGDERRVMRPGDDLALPGGRLRYMGLSSWMGYRVFYDWTLHWILAASLVAIAAMAAHFARRAAARPWDE